MEIYKEIICESLSIAHQSMLRLIQDLLYELLRSSLYKFLYTLIELFTFTFLGSSDNELPFLGVIKCTTLSLI